MPRGARKKSCNGVYHIIFRGVNRQVIFEGEEDKLRFLSTVVRYKKSCGFKLYAYCLMDNHVHLLLKESEESVSRIVQRICASYVLWYNNKYDRSGHLFQERFRSENVESIPYFLSVLRYIHQNPVKAGLSKDVFTCQWTSIHEYFHHSTIIDTSLALQLLSPDPEKAISMFKEKMKVSLEDQFLDDVPTPKLTDQEVLEELKCLGVENKSNLQKMNKHQRDSIVLELTKLNGITTPQLTRTTGLSKTTINRIKKEGRHLLGENGYSGDRNKETKVDEPLIFQGNMTN
ncbi:transposase [Bacillaceae bacterium S4-13-58]